MIAGWLMLAALLGVDAGAAPEAKIPLWAPRMRPVDVTSEARYDLRRWGDGYLFEDSRFEARVAPDGVVTFKDTRVSASLLPFSWLFKRDSRKVTVAPSDVRMPADPSANRRGPWLPTPPSPGRPAPGTLEPTEVCPKGSSCEMLPDTGKVSVVGSFDLTDEIMRGLGQDPYRYEKARFLSATFEFRIRLAIEARKEDMRRALNELPQNLNALWQDDRYTTRERRRILYELWYEMDRTADGRRAAEIIEAFIRKRLPCGARDGYSRAELDALDKAHPDRPFSLGKACR